MHRMVNCQSLYIYNFPIEAPFLVMFFDAYSAGKHASFDGSECYLIGCCGMCSFACMEPIQQDQCSGPLVEKIQSTISYDIVLYLLRNNTIEYIEYLLTLLNLCRNLVEKNFVGSLLAHTR
jgi:hypothetical protein